MWQQQCYIHILLDFDAEPTVKQNKKRSPIGKSCYIIKQRIHAATCKLAVFRATHITSPWRQNDELELITSFVIYLLLSFLENPRSEVSSAEKDELYLRRSQLEHGEGISVADQVWRLLCSLEQNIFGNSFHILECQFL